MLSFRPKNKQAKCSGHNFKNRIEFSTPTLAPKPSNIWGNLDIFGAIAQKLVCAKIYTIKLMDFYKYILW